MKPGLRVSATNSSSNQALPLLALTPDALGDPDSAPWRSDFAIIYANSMYLRVGGNLSDFIQARGWWWMSRILFISLWSMYQPRDSDGFPKFSKKVELRVDINRQYKCHIHYE